jgi:hypothetical protein
LQPFAKVKKESTRHAFAFIALLNKAMAVEVCDATMLKLLMKPGTK